MDWMEFGKGLGVAAAAMGSFLGSARLWRRIDSVQQARSKRAVQVIETESSAGVDVLARYQTLADQAEDRAARAESRELLAVQRADRAEERERAAVERADAADSRARIAENKVRELEARIEKLERILGGRQRHHA